MSDHPIPAHYAKPVTPWQLEEHMSTNDTQQTSTPDADFCGELRTTGGHCACAYPKVTFFNGSFCYACHHPIKIDIAKDLDSEMVGQPVWNGIGQPGSVMPLPETRALDPAPAAPDTPETDLATHRQMSDLMNADSWERAWRDMAIHARNLERQRDEAQRALREERMLHARTFSELDEARKQRDALANALESVSRRAPIMGSTGDYREGQLDAIRAVAVICHTELASVKGGSHE